jgi:hypothetical protein
MNKEIVFNCITGVFSTSKLKLMMEHPKFYRISTTHFDLHILVTQMKISRDDSVKLSHSISLNK